MKFLKYAVIVLVCVLTVHFLPFFIKRCKLYFRLKRECKSIGATLIGTHPLWFLGTRFGSSNDFYIEIQEKVFSVKLFSMNSRRKMLYFNDKGSFFFRKYTVFMGGFGATATFTLELSSEVQRFFEKDFLRRFPPETFARTPVQK